MVEAASACLTLVVAAACAISAAGQNNRTSHTQEDKALSAIVCSSTSDCGHVEGSTCDARTRRCACKREYPHSDSRHCYKDARSGEFCRLHVQCQRLDGNAWCNVDLNVCQCQPGFSLSLSLSLQAANASCRPEPGGGSGSTSSSIVDPTFFGIMGGLALMFIILCVVLQLFARAQFQDANRTIFNTPNPRLMNVSLLSGRDATTGRKGSSSASRQQNRENAVAAAAAVAALHLGSTTIITHDLEMRRTSSQVDRAEGHAFLRQGSSGYLVSADKTSEDAAANDLGCGARQETVIIEHATEEC